MKTRLNFLLSIAMLFAAMCFTSAAPIERVNVSSNEEQANGGSSETTSLPNLSDDGHFVVFNSIATNLVPGDTNEGSDVFVRDIVNGTTTRVSVSSGGAQAEGIPGLTLPSSYTPSISADGRYIVFATTAQNFVSGSQFSDGYIVLHDRLLGTTIGVTDPAYVDNTRPVSSQRRGQGFDPCISADGNVVAFQSTDGAFVVEDTNTTRDIFVWTRTTGAYERISVTNAGAQVSSNNYSNPRLNADGSLVVFSTTVDLVPNAISGSVVYLRDRANDTTEIVSLDSAEAPVSGHSATISRDGRYVTFVTAQQLDAVDTNGTDDVYIRDRVSGTTELCSRKPNGSLFNGTVKNPVISGNGRYVAFIGPGQFDSGGIIVMHDDLFVLDRQTGAVVEAGNGLAGDADGLCRLPSLSNNGQFLRFESAGENLVANDTNFVIDVFLKDRSQEVSNDPVASPPFVRLTEGASTTVSVSPPASVANPNSIFKALSGYNPSVVEVTPTGEVTPSGTNPAQFTFKAVGIGTTAVTIEFKNGSSGTPSTVSVPLTVTLPADSTANNDYTADGGDPVDTRNGEYHAIESVPMRLGGPMPLSFAIYHASRLSLDSSIESVLGENRLHTFETLMTAPSATRREIVTNRGRVIAFEKGRRSWELVGRADIRFQLVESGTEFVLGDPRSQRLWTYDAASGQLLKIEDGRGNTHTLTYNGDDLLATVADGLGRSLAFTYASGRLTRVTDHTARHVDFVHTGAVLTSMTDPLGHTTTYAHDGNGQITSYTKPEGNAPFTQTFTDGKVVSQSERATDTSTLLYAGNTTTFTNPAGATLVDTYAATGELVAHADEAGKAVAMTSDATGRRASVTDREGDTTRIVYHALSGKPAVITNAEGRSVTMAYKPRKARGVIFFDLVSLTFPDGARESYIRDSFGNVLSRIDRAGKKWSFTYNNRGQLLTATNPLRGVSVFTYDAAGNLATRKDPDTEATTYAYDLLNRPITITRPGGATATLAYDAADRLLTSTDERGKITAFDYDDNNRLTSVTDADTNSTDFVYDVLDRVQEVTDRTGASSSVSYNSRRLLASSTDRNGNVTTFNYDALQRPVGITDAGAKTWAAGFDAEGLLVSAANPVDAPGKVKRNSLGRAIEVSDALGNTASANRDAMQRVVVRFNPLGRATAYTYDKRGLLTSATEQGTGTAKYSYDALGSLSALIDPAGGIWSFDYTPAGRAAGMTDPLGRASSHTYDPRGRRAVTTFADGATLTRSYDDANNVTRRFYSDGTDLTFAYDNLNRMTATNGLALSYDAEGRITNSAQAGENFGATYDAGGRLITVTSPRNGGAFTVTYGYDSRNRLISVGDNLSNVSITFGYDDAGRLLTVTRNNGVDRTLTYDAAGRLARIQDGTFLDLKYSLNAADEVAATDYTAPQTPAVAPETKALTFDKASQISSTGYGYDARGRLITSPTGGLTWDGASRLRTVGGATLTYNGLDDVITRTVAAVTTRLFYNYALRLNPVVAEKAEGGAFLRHYVWTPGGRLLYGIDGASSEPFFFHFDRTGSTLALTDDAGAVTDAYAYGPYGELLGRAGTSAQPFTYVGAMGVRAEGALHQMRARYYDPSAARFVSRDPIWPALARPKRLNPYEYAAQSPGEFIDPSGRSEVKIDLTRHSLDYQMAAALFPDMLSLAITEHDEATRKLEDGDLKAWQDSQDAKRFKRPPAPPLYPESEESILDEIEEVLVLCDMYAPSAIDRLPIAKPKGKGSTCGRDWLASALSNTGCSLLSETSGYTFAGTGFAGIDDCGETLDSCSDGLGCPDGSCICPPSNQGDIFVNANPVVAFRREQRPWSIRPNSAKCGFESLGSLLSPDTHVIAVEQ